MPHEKLTFDSFSCEYNLTADSTHPVKLNWKSQPQDGHYELTIAKNGGTAGKTYSLYSLCVQGRGHAVEITPSSGSPKFWKDEDATTEIKPPVGSSVITVPKTNGSASNVRFITFAGNNCVLLVKSSRTVTHRMKRTASLTDHDTIPDPPVSGGQ